ncbi:serine protease [Paraburkholderia phenazinium]|jgi:serine protease|uniref:Serine protease n=2 Tax=Paraburkholderia phenazinium TaxID=60549 RepID=A0A1N6JSI7_9BURK|nr:serine protease [Paraburkholderia phenazinium]
MQEYGSKIRRICIQHTIGKTGYIWSRLSTQRIIASAVGVALTTALAACGGSNSSTTSSQAAPTTQEIAEVAAAKSAAHSTSVPLATSLKMNASSITSNAQINRFIVTYKSGTVERGSTQAVQSKLDKLASAFPAKAHHLRRMGIGADLVMTERKLNSKEALAFMRAIATDPNVEYVEPDVAVQGGMIPNDPDFGRQWALNSQPGIRPAGAWDLTDGSGAIIALVDNGVTHHSDLDANLLPGMDVRAGHQGGSGFNPGITTETCHVDWHGTTVAGVLAAITNNGNGIAGTAGGAKIVPVRVLDACGTGFISDVADGIVWAAGGSLPGVPDNANPAKVVNVSIFGFGACGSAVQQAINDATARGASIVTISGNSENDAAKYQPGNCRNVITVGNVRENDSRGGLSNFGPSVDIAAPGTDIWTTSNDGTSAPGPETYGYFAGTSYAAPFVSGVIALAQSVTPKPLTPSEMRALLMQNVHPFGPESPDFPSGAGVLDATATVTAARSGKIPAAADFTCSQGQAGMLVTCTDLSTARGAPLTSWAWNLGFGDPSDMVRAQSVNPYYDYEYPGIYNVTLAVTDSTGAVSRVTRPFQVVAPNTTGLSRNIPVKFSANAYVMQYFALAVPAGVTSLTFTLSPGSYSDIGTLFLRAGSPTTRNADCESVAVRGGAATCTISNPPAGTYYGTVNPNTSLTGATIQATYTQ